MRLARFRLATNRPIGCPTHIYLNAIATTLILPQGTFWKCISGLENAF